MYKFNTTKEYIITYEGLDYRVICTKVIKDTQGNIRSVCFKEVSKENVLIVENLNLISNTIIPIDNTEFFTMYINWLNFYRKGLHQDLNYAKELFIKIDSTLKQRTTIIKGSGAFLPYDNRLYMKLYETYNVF